jgi:hypothetical protein
LFSNPEGKCDPTALSNHWTFTECKCAEKQPCLCTLGVPAPPASAATLAPTISPSVDPPSDRVLTYFEVDSGSCESHGFETLTDAEECTSAAAILGKTIDWGPYGGYRDVVTGCSLRGGSGLFFNPEGTCDPTAMRDHWTFTACQCVEWQPCLCIS